MLDDRVKMLIATVKKLYHRDAKQNIQRILSKTHEADIAAILESFDSGERFDLFKMETSWEKRAEILSRLAPEIQQELLACLSRQEALQLVSHMDSDDVADLLALLPEEESRDILASMGKKDSDEVADLMGYPEDSAGGLMSSDYLALSQDLTVAEAVKELQNNDEDLGSAFYIYVINEDKKLVGVLSLKQLLLSKKNEQLNQLMVTDVISVTLDMDQEKVAKSVEHYDFLSIPVIDNTNQLMGIITVDDVIDVIREEAEEDFLAMGQAGLDFNASTFERLKARLPWVVISFIGGLISFLIVFYWGPNSDTTGINVLWAIAAFIPMLLAIGGTTGSQSVTVSVGAVRSGKYEWSDLFSNFNKELRLAVVLAVIFAIIVAVTTQMILAINEFVIIFGLAVGLQIIISMAVGNIIPWFIHKINSDPTVASVPVYATVSGVSAIIVLLTLYHGFGL